LEKVACGAFSDSGFVTARKRRDFCGLPQSAQVSRALDTAAAYSSTQFARSATEHDPIMARAPAFLLLSVSLLAGAWLAARATPASLEMTGSERSAAEEFLAARASGDPQQIAAAIHPAELEELRTRILALLHKESARGDSTVRGRLFGPAMSLDAIEHLTSANFYAAIATRLWMPAREYEHVKALAVVPGRDGTVHAVVEGVQAREHGSKLEVVELVTLRPYGKDWKAAIPEEVQAQIEDLMRGLRGGGSATAATGAPTPAGITALLDSAERSLDSNHCDEYYRERMSENFRRVTAKKALETLIAACQNNQGTREMLLATLRIVREKQPQFEYEGQRAVYDLSGQGLPYDRFVLEQVNRKWYIAE
jgi:hypothetical protein